MEKPLMSLGFLMSHSLTHAKTVVPADELTSFPQHNQNKQVKAYSNMEYVSQNSREIIDLFLYSGSGRSCYIDPDIINIADMRARLTGF